MAATPESLRLFVSSCQGLKDEKSDSQTFLNRFFQAFGYSDAIAAGRFRLLLVQACARDYR